MKLLFLIAVFMLIIFSVSASHAFENYDCEASHKHSSTTFHLKMGETKDVEVGGWKILAGLMAQDPFVEVSLTRVVTVLGASYQKVAKRKYPAEAQTLPVQLVHGFGGKNDVFNLICFPRSI